MTCHLINKAVMKQNCIEALLYLLLLFFDPGTQFPWNEKLRYAIQKVQKSSWNEPYLSSKDGAEFARERARHCYDDLARKRNQSKHIGCEEPAGPTSSQSSYK